MTANQRLAAGFFVLAGFCIVAVPAQWGLAQEKAQQSKSFANTLGMTEGQSSEPIDVSEFGWLEGSWEGSGLGGDCTEVWSSVAGGMTVGSFRFVKDDKVIFTEHFQLKSTGNSVELQLKHFDHDLKGWEDQDEKVTFRFIKREGDSFFFDGLTYRRSGPGHMQAFVRISHDDGTVDEAQFDFKRRDRSGVSESGQSKR